MAHTMSFPQTIKTLVKSRYLNIVFILGFIGIAFLMFYNLDINPRSWQDEGASMSVARTLVEDGVYAVRSSDGYQTFGPVQSVGPTVILPVALAFKLFGISILSARIVAVIYSILALLLFFLVGKKIFGTASAVFACLFLLAYPATSFFYFGRQALGDYPALAFFFGALMIYGKGYTTRKRVYFVLSGLLLGGAMITKSQYTVFVCGALAVMGLLDFFTNHRKNIFNLLITGAAAVACFVLWMVWQYVYFGPAVFLADSEKLRQLALSTSGFHIGSTIMAIRHLFGINSGYFFLYWGFPALIYVGFGMRRPDELTSPKSFLLIFATLALLYFVFWTLPWMEYVVAPSAVIALFVGKLLNDVIQQLVSLYRKYRHAGVSLRGYQDNLMMVTALMAIVPIFVYTGYSLQKLAASDILDRVGTEDIIYRGPRSFQNFTQITEYLNENTAQNTIVETWERELFIVTDNNFHFPDQSILIASHSEKYRDGVNSSLLGKSYFEKVRPDYIVIGWFTRDNPIYDMNYIATHSQLIKSFGNDRWGYDLYRMSPGLE